MPSVIPGFEYDIFISYRHKDNKGGHWVTEFVDALKEELDATFKEDITIYFDENPHDGLLETHNVDKTLEGKLKCLIFIPILSQTYCDPKSFAWQHEFCAFNKMAKEDQFGVDIRLSNGNVASRILCVKIHDLDPEDKSIIEKETGGVLRAIEFIYKEPGVNRPLKSNDAKADHQNKTDYRNQVNKVANAIKDLIVGVTHQNSLAAISMRPVQTKSTTSSRKQIALFSTVAIIIGLVAYGFFYFGGLGKKLFKEPKKSIAVLPFKNLSNDAEQEYFTQGITEDILNHLAKIADLRVKASYASFNYKESTKSISEIGEELEVSSILTGSIQRVGENVRIIARLVDVETNDQIWSENYDRKIDEMLTVQSNIALEIASVLQAKLSTSEAISINRIATQNINAYDSYLRARIILQGARDTGFARKEFNYALTLLNKSIALDPNLADAYGWKGVAWHLASQFGFSERIWLDSSLYFAEKSIHLDPQNPLGYLLRYRLKMFTPNYSQDLSDLEKAYSYAPNNTDILGVIGFEYLEAGKAEGADLVVKNITLQNTTKDAGYYASWAWAYQNSGDSTTAEKLINEALRIDPQSVDLFTQKSYMMSLQHDYPAVIQYSIKAKNKLLAQGKSITEMAQNMATLTEAYTFMGKLDSAEYYSQIFPDLEKTFSDTTQYIPYRHRLGYFRWQQGDKKEAMKFFREQLELDSARLVGRRGIGAWGDFRSVYYDLGVTHAFLGNKEIAYKAFDEISKSGIPNWMIEYFETDPMLAGIRKEARFVSLMEKIQSQKQFRRDAMRAAINRYEAGKELKDRIK